MTFIHPLACALAALFALGACRTPPEEKPPPSPFAPAPDPKAGPPDLEVKKTPWTGRFAKESALVAMNVRIEGPRGLLEHVAIVDQPDLHERTVTTIPEGFLQTIKVRPDAPGAEIRAHLDNLTVLALRELVVLERPGLVDVLVIANGDAFYSETNAPGSDQRGDSLRFEGKIKR
jgi:hypothetical protein